MHLSDHPESGGPPRRYLDVAQRLMVAIAQGDLRVGDRLPAERTLASESGVSRATAREALLVLELAGVIEVRNGAGVYVTRPGARGLPDGRPHIDAPPRDLLDARSLIEPQVTALIARQSPELDGIASLRQLVEHSLEMVEKAANIPQLVEQGLEFHLRLSKIAHNSILSDIVFQLVNSGGHPLWLLVNQQAMRDPEFRSVHTSQHAQILNAIELGHPNDARSLMREHIEGLKRQVFPS